MKVYKYKDRNIIEFANKSRVSLATKKYGETLNQITQQIEETGFRLGNAYNFLDNNIVEILYWDTKNNKTIKIYVDYDIWYQHKEITWTVNSNGYAWGCIVGTKNRVFLHRVVMGIENNQHDFNTVVDHIDGNKLNNLKSNLRIVDSELNAKNQPYYNTHNQSTGIRGISYTQDKSAYRVRWIADGKEHAKIFSINELESAIEFNKQIRKSNGYIVREE